MFPSYNTAATEAACMGYGVIFQHYDDLSGGMIYGVVWWDGDTRYVRGLLW